MIQEIMIKIKDKKLVIFGEIHGTKEIPELLSEFFNEMVNEEDFNVCFEIPEDYKNNIRKYFEEEPSDGKNSKEYFELIQNLRSLSKKHNREIGIFFVAPSFF